MTTHFGLCPSFPNWTSRLPLFADPLRRGKLFEVFGEDGVPTGEPSPIGPDGWPAQDGRWHGVRLFGDQDGFLPDLRAGEWPPSMRLRVNPGRSAWVSWRGGKPDPYPRLSPALSRWHLPSLEALAYFRPKALRTLDWGYQARKEKRPDWTVPRVSKDALIQGEEMAVELQCKAANLLNCALWWNAPPRFELSAASYKLRLEEMLIAVRDNADKPPILEYGNELWNDGFPVKRWLETAYTGSTWQKAAANEIIRLEEVADRVFGPGDIMGQRAYHLFVGGHIGTPDTLDKILRELPFTPAMAGPALYATPLKVDRDQWQQQEQPPTQEALRASMFANLPGLRAKLDAHRIIVSARGVPFFGVYEAGQSLIANGRPWKTAALEAQRSEWMGEMYRSIREHLNAAGVNLACWYSAATDQAPGDARVDVFGLLEATLDKASPLPKAVAARGA